MAEWSIDDNESGMMDYEAYCYEQEQEILRANPAWSEWLDSLKAQSTKENENGYHRI